jgi:Ni/Fe-hydrogenase 1 B-type cytochrome subunit
MPRKIPTAASGRTHPAKVIYVYEAPVRIWHWVTAVAMVVLMVTGYLIGSPPPSVGGEAAFRFLFGNVRFIHFAAGQVMAVAYLLRVLWAIIGNEHARQVFIVPVWQRQWWRDVFDQIRWYAFLTKESKHYIDHNPLAQVAMFLMVMVTSLFMICTGFAMYSQDLGNDSWQFKAFGWVFSLFPNAQTVHTLHHLGMWVLVVFTIIHLYLVVREDITSRETITSTMISGKRVLWD